MYPTVNTKIQSFTREEAISPNRSTDRGGRALSYKLQATSFKRQATSTKLQAPSSDKKV